MVLFNYSTRELTAKIVYYGPGLCGKTTNLQFIHQNLPGDVKGKMLSLATKTDRTLFFDFLPLDLGSIRGMKTRVQLYTVPGQVFYNETRKLVLKGADGIVFVADSQKQMLSANVESFRNLEENLKAHGLSLGTMPHVIQFNKRDLPNLASIEELNAALNKYNAPFYESVATTGIGVQDTLRAIVKLVLLHLTKKYDPQASGTKPAASAKADRAPSAEAPRPTPGRPDRVAAAEIGSQSAPPLAASIPVSDFDPVATQKQAAETPSGAGASPGAGASSPPPPPDFFGATPGSDPVSPETPPSVDLSAEPAAVAEDAVASAAPGSAPPPPPDFYGGAPDPEEAAVPEFGDDDIEELVEEVEEIQQQPEPAASSVETPLAAAPPLEPGESLPPEPTFDGNPPAGPAPAWSLESGTAEAAATDAADSAPGPTAPPAFEVDRTFDPEWAAGAGAGAGAAELGDSPAEEFRRDLSAAPEAAAAHAEPADSRRPPEPDSASEDAEAAADAAVDLDAPAPDAELFQDPDLDVARLQPGEQRTVVVPVELGEGPEKRRYKLSIALRLDSVE